MKTENNFYDALFYANATSTSKEVFHLPNNEFKLLLKLIHYSKNQKNITWTSSEISKHITMPVGAIDKAIQRLKQRGYITTTTYNLDTFTKHRTIFVNWNKIDEIDGLYKLSLSKDNVETTISTQPIPEVQVEEKVLEIEANDVIESNIEIGGKKLEAMGYSNISLSQFKVPNAYVEYWPLIEDKLGLINNLKREYNQTDFNITLQRYIRQQLERQFV